MLDFVSNLQVTSSIYFSSFDLCFLTGKGDMWDCNDLECPLQLVLNLSTSAPAPTALCFAAVK